MPHHATDPADRDPVRPLFLGWARDASGFADELRGFLRACEQAGLQPRLANLRSMVPTELSTADKRMLDAQERRPRDGRLVAVHSYVPWPRQPHVAGVPSVMRAMYETDRLPERRLPLLLDHDEIWVPGDFNVETFERGGIPRERMRVLGGTLDFDLFTPGAVEPANLRVPDDHVVFLTNFAFSERKAWRQLLHGWSLAFGPDDGVCLVLKVHSEGRRTQIRDRIDAFLREELGAGAVARLAPIRVVDDVLPADQMPRLYAAADAYVLPTRGEGWGRPYMEALAMGLPTIASRWSGQLEFLHDGNAWLVDGDVVPVEHAEEVFLDPLPGHRWFQPDIDSLAAQLRAVAGDLAAAKAKAVAARPELVARFGPETIARRVAELSEAAHERHAERRARPVTAAIRGPFGSVSSLAVVNDALAEGLEARGHHLRRSVGGSHPTAAPIAEGEQPTIFHHWPPDFVTAPAGPAVHILPWEYGAPPADWVANVNRGADRVWVYSDAIRRGYVEAGMAPGLIEVLPLGVDTGHFTPDGPRRRDAAPGTCTFLFVGGTIWRKGVDLLVRAWADAFGPDDDVRLIIKDFGTQTHYRGQSVLDAAALARDPALAPIEHLTDEIPYHELPALYRGADVLVAPYRAEGFCLPALEAMACGLPVIHNGAGPTAEFVPADAGWALTARRVTLPRNADLDLASDGWVHEVEHGALVAALREAAADAAERVARGRRGAAAAAQRSWTHVAQRAEELLRTLAEEGLPPVRQVSSAVIDAPGATVLYALDGDWAGTVHEWAMTFSAGDPVTLQLFAGDADVAAQAAEIEAVLAATGRDEADLPDLALCLPSDHSFDALVLGVDAVLAGPGGAAALPAFARRRARRVLDGPADLAAFAAQLRGPVAPAPPALAPAA
jgi:glycosyltransferase involved in cell wall biosynthesis